MNLNQQWRNQLPQTTGTPNLQQFQQWLPQINDNMMNQLVQQARGQGISEQDIQKGLQMIANLRQSR